MNQEMDLRKRRVCRCAGVSRVMNTSEFCHWSGPGICSVCVDNLAALTKSDTTEPFDINSAFVSIASAAKYFLTGGDEHIWIYLLSGNKLHFHYKKVVILDRYYVADYCCRSILAGLSNRAWGRLGVNIAVAVFEAKDDYAEFERGIFDGLFYS
ncbi:hypothetical protein ES705_11430 [subsurface metagenome]